MFFLADLFLTVNDFDIARYADDNIPYMIADNVDDLATSLEQASNGFFEWFKNNLLKSNADKCHLFVSTNDRVSMNVDGFKIDKSDTEKLLGVKFDKKLAFDDHISDICIKAGRKISALARITPYMVIAKKCMLVNAFFTSQFSYCPQVWMCYSHTNNNKISRLHERYLRIVCNDKQSSLNELLEKDGSVSIHMRNIQILATEMYKRINNLSPPIMDRVFKLNSNSRYNLRQISQFVRSLVKSVYHGKERISCLGPKIWDILPDDDKAIQNLDTFKNKIKKWKPEKSTCRLCKVYIDRVGFL